MRNNVFIRFVFIVMICFTTGKAIAFNNPFLSLKDCSGVIINDTTTGFYEKKANFGDGGGLSTYMIHQYLNSGTYFIKYYRYLNSWGLPVDSFTDTVQISIITHPVFNYKTHCNTLGNGIFNFQLNGINKSSGTAYGDCVVDDYTCSDQVILNEGQVYQASATTDTLDKEYITVFLDANADGRFQREEIVGESGALTNHSFQIVVPHVKDSLFGVPLRLRVVCTTIGTVPFFNPGSGYWYHVNDMEDYSVIVNSHTPDPPQASFKSYTYCDGLTVIFLNTSIGAPDSVRWYFPDGTVSTEFSPYYTYSSKASQTVDMVVYNANGMDSIHSELDNPTLPHIYHTDPAYLNQQITFQTGHFPKELSWRWTFPEVPFQSIGPIAYNSYSTVGAFPFTLTMQYIFSDILYSGYYPCIATTDDTIFITTNAIAENSGNVFISVENHFGNALLTINSPHYGKVSVTTIDLNGRVENTYSFNKSTFSMTQELSFKQNGLYLILIEDEAGNYIHKFLVIQ